MRILSENLRCFGNRHFNLFLVGQRRCALVECGVSAAVYNLEQQWSRLEDPRPQVDYLLSMHAHFDHVCGIPALKKMFPDAAVTASAAALKVFSKAHIMKDFFSQDMSMAQLLKERGLVDREIEIPDLDHIDVSILMSPGDTIKLEPGIELQILASPGHSPDSLAAYLPGDRVLFISDAAGFQISDHDIFPVFFHSYPAYIDTIRSLMAYPVKILALPHGTIWTGQDIQSFFHRAIGAAEELFALIRRLSEKGVDNKAMQDLVYQRYYQGDLCIYTPANISTCVELLVRRVQECL